MTAGLWPWGFDSGLRLPDSADAGAGALGGRRESGGPCLAEVCPWNHRPQAQGDPRFSPRPLAALTPAEVAALSAEDFQRLSAGMAVARAQYDGLRRNALYAIGGARDRSARPVVARLSDDPSPPVRDARWAAEQLDLDRGDGA